MEPSQPFGIGFTLFTFNQQGANCNTSTTQHNKKNERSLNC